MTGMTIIEARTSDEAMDKFDAMTIEEKARDLTGETTITIFDGDFIFDEDDFERFMQGWIDTIQRYEEEGILESVMEGAL
jgi:hypothetical protein